jgi:hypothetical protein
VLAGLEALKYCCGGVREPAHVKRVFDWLLLESVIAGKGQTQWTLHGRCTDLTSPQGSQCYGLLEALR